MAIPANSSQYHQAEHNTAIQSFSNKLQQEKAHNSSHISIPQNVEQQPNPAEPHSSPTNQSLAYTSLAATPQQQTREARILAAVSASANEWSQFQSSLASRVNRDESLLCLTNAGDEWRMKQERSMLYEQKKRIARQAAAQHTTTNIQLSLPSAATIDGDNNNDSNNPDTDIQGLSGTALPWEQSLRGAVNHSIQIGNMFTGLYCIVGQTEMKDMQIIRSNKQIQEDRQRYEKQPITTPSLTATNTNNRLSYQENLIFTV